jgi:type I restriction enzyme M protein
LNEKGRAGFVMAGGAESAGASEKEMRKQLITSHAVDVIVAVGPKMFYTVTLGCVLWFLDHGKTNTPRGDKVLFIDARHICRQVDRAHREWTPDQLRFLAEIVRNYRGEKRSDNWQPPWDEITLPESLKAELRKTFATCRHIDIPGLCRQVSLAEIAEKGHTLQPGTWVGVTPGEVVDDEDFKQQLETLNKELETLNAEARDIEQTIASNVAEILEA